MREQRPQNCGTKLAAAIPELGALVRGPHAGSYRESACTKAESSHVHGLLSQQSRLCPD